MGVECRKVLFKNERVNKQMNGLPIKKVTIDFYFIFSHPDFYPAISERSLYQQTVLVPYIDGMARRCPRKVNICDVISQSLFRHNALVDQDFDAATSASYGWLGLNKKIKLKSDRFVLMLKRVDEAQYRSNSSCIETLK